MVGYVFFQYFYYRKKTDAGRRHMVGMQNFFLFCVHFLGYLILFLKTEDSKILVMYAIQLVFFAAYILLYRAIYKNASRQLVTNACMLLTIGFIIQTRLSYTKAFKQMIIALAAAAVTLFGALHHPVLEEDLQRHLDLRRHRHPAVDSWSARSGSVDTVQSFRWARTAFRCSRRNSSRSPLCSL